MLGEEVNDTSASIVVAQLLFLEAEDPEKDIHLYINSPGGVITAGWFSFSLVLKICFAAMSISVACPWVPPAG